MALGGRFFAGFGAALFLVTSSALTIAVILSLTSGKNNTTSDLNVTANSNSCPSGFSVAVGSKLPNFTAQTKPVAHLELSDLHTGTGASVPSGATVTACYVGALADSGVVFDTSNAHGGPLSFSLSSVIAGWQVGIPGMKVGGTRELLIPAAMGYGAQKNGSIPANSDLFFYVSIVSVKK